MIFNALYLRPRLSESQLILLVCVYFTVVLNAPLLNRFTTAIMDLPNYNIWSVLSVPPLLLLSLLVFLFSLLSHRFILKPLLVMITLISSLVFYGEMTYGIVFGYNMIQNMTVPLFIQTA